MIVNMNKENGLSRTIVVIIITILVLTVLTVVIMFNTKSNDVNEGNTSKNSGKVNYADGIVPYNKEISNTAMTYITYKDNTRDMTKQTSTYFFKKANMNKTINFIDFSFYLKRNEKEILSYKWDKNKGFGYEFLEMNLDDSGDNYIYFFSSLDDNAIVVVTSVDMSKADSLNLVNAEERKLNNKIIYKGIYNDKYNAFRYNEEENGLKYSLIYITSENDEKNALNKIDEFNTCISSDNGSPFIIDYMITNNTIAYRHIKSYKYVTGIVPRGKVAGLVGGYDLNLNYEYILKNNYVYEGTMPTRTAIVNNVIDDYSKIFGGKWKTKLFYSNNEKTSEMSLIAKQNSNDSINGYNMFIVKDYNSSIEFEKYTRDFMEMLVLDD